MAHTKLSVNNDAFFDLFPGPHLFRAIHDDYDRKTDQPQALRPRSFYGHHSAYANQLQALNRRGFSIFFTANDPHGLSAKKENFTELRCIYQDADDPQFSHFEPLIAGRPAHLVWETSPGKRQRIWLTEPLPVDWQTHITQIMVERAYHDAEALGEFRLLRLPGYENCKAEYCGFAPVELLTVNNTPLLTVQDVEGHFFGEPGDPNSVNAMEQIQRSGDKPRTTVVDLNKERAKRGGTDRTVEAERTRKALAEAPVGTLETSRLLDVLARLDPDTGRNEWRRVLGALHWMSEGAAWGEDIADRWSALGIRQYDAGAFAAHWAGLDSSHGHPTHWGTLEGIARMSPIDAAARARRSSPTFRAFEEQHGPVLSPVRFLTIHFPETRFTGNAVTVEPDSVKNVEALLEARGWRVRFDEFRHDIVLNDDAILNRVDMVDLWAEAYRHNFKVNKRALADHVEAIAMQSRFNPVATYFNALRGKWDGKPRLNTFCQRHLGAPDRLSVRETFTLFMVAMVRRARQPGCKFDLMPLFQSRQGLGKSSVFKRLVPREDWFSDSPDLSLESKRLFPMIQGKLIIEFAELTGKSTKEIGKIKGMITKTQDEWIANYATRQDSVPRIAVFVGTTNELTPLRDTTGNRRFPIIPVNKELNWNDLEAEKEQLWAEAVFLEDIWDSQLRLTPEAVVDMEAIQGTRLELSSDVEEILYELGQFENPFISKESLWYRLGLPDEMRSQRRQPVHKFAMKELENLLATAGWDTTSPALVNGKTQRGYHKHKKGVAVREIVYSNHRLVYKTDLDNEAEELLK